MTKHTITTDIPKPCPECGSVRYVIKSHFDIWIECKKCGHAGAHAEKLADAIKKWNRQEKDRS